jgi:hypothetical protein
MIDRNARNQAANLVEGYWAGKISNDDLEDAWPNSKDRGVVAVFGFMWTLYDDLKTHFVHQEDVDNVKLNCIVKNCVEFLRSDDEYTWPHSAVIYGNVRYSRWAVIVSLGLLGWCNRLAAARERRYWNEMHAHGDVEAWPFTVKRVR